MVKEIKGKMGIDITSSAISPNTIGTLLVSMYIENHSSNKLDAWIEVNFMELLIDLNQRDYSFEKEDLYYVKSRFIILIIALEFGIVMSIMLLNDTR